MSGDCFAGAYLLSHSYFQLGYICLHAYMRDIILIFEFLVANFQINVCNNASDDLIKWSILSSQLG